MSYKPIKSPQVEEMIRRLPSPLTRFVEEWIERVALRPSEFGRSGGLFLSGQLAQESISFQGMDYHFDLFFRFGADEQTLFFERLFLETV